MQTRRPDRALSGRVVVLLAATVLGLTVLALVFLVWPAPVIHPRTTAERLDALRTVIAVAAGSGAGATLLLAARRQVHQERVALATEFDATERRITELYTKAVDQLGSDKAAVRLGGLHSLERLGNDHLQLRQTVVDMLAAYLRMLPADPDELLAVAGRNLSIDLPADDDTSSPDLLQELQVRLTAQRLLTGHLMGQPTEDQGVPSAVALESWGKVNIDLTGAVLFNLTLTGATLGRAVFDHARFYGHTDFTGSSFLEEASFTGAAFSSWAAFNKSRFAKSVTFSKAHFGPDSNADFMDVRFEREAHFWQCAMEGGVRFIGSTFAKFLNFREARLSGSPAGNLFRGIEVDGNLHFENCVFASDTTFAGAVFRGTVGFDGTIFGRTVSFQDATIANDTGMLDHATIVLNPRRIELLERFYDANHLPPGWQVVPVDSPAEDDNDEDDDDDVSFGRFVREDA